MDAKTYVCQHCGTVFTEDYRKDPKIRRKTPPRFCCRKCSNSKRHSSKTKEKIRQTIKSQWVKKPNGNWHEVHQKFIKAGIEAARKRGKILHEQAIQKILSADPKTLSPERLKKRLLHECNFTCQKCGNSEWLGQPIALEIEHKDGNHQNNEYSNLTLLCPNCHAQTETYRGRNKGMNKETRKKFPSDEKLVELAKTHHTVRQLLLACGMTPVGANYDAMKKAILRLGITDVKFY